MKWTKAATDAAAESIAKSLERSGGMLRMAVPYLRPLKADLRRGFEDALTAALREQVRVGGGCAACGGTGADLSDITVVRKG